MIIVAQDDSGHFNNIQAAVDSIPDNNTNEVEILIKRGTYREKLSICKPFITFIGEDKDHTTITYDDYARKLFPNGEPYRTFNSFTIFIGSNNFTAKNITFENSAGVGEVVGQAIAAYVEGDKVKFINCRFLGNQDTLFTGPLPPKPIEGNNFGGPMDGKPRITGRQYYESCYIEGDIDFIFGSATAVFNKCEIFSKDRGKKINGYITAASTIKGREFGYVFFNCKLTSNAKPNTFYLGRPWRDYAKTAFINCYMGNHIIKEGWDNWNKPIAEKEATYVEYNNYGPGASNYTRVLWSHILSDKESEKYNISNIFGDWNI